MGENAWHELTHDNGKPGLSGPQWPKKAIVANTDFTLPVSIE